MLSRTIQCSKNKSLTQTKIPCNVLPLQGISVKVNFFLYQEGVRNVSRESFPNLSK